MINWYSEKSFFVAEFITHELQQDVRPGNQYMQFSRKCHGHKMPMTLDHGEFLVVNIDKLQCCFCKSNFLVIQSKENSRGE